MTEQEIRKLIPELVWEKADNQHSIIGHEDYQALDNRLGLEKVYYRIVHYSRDPEGMYYLSKVAKHDPYQDYPCWLITTAYSLEDAKQLAQEHRAKAVCQMLMTTPSSDQPEKPSIAKTINVEKLIERELDRLSDEDRRGEWDTLPNEMKYLKRKLCETLRSYIILLDQLEKCEDKNAELKRCNEL